MTATFHGSAASPTPSRLASAPPPNVKPLLSSCVGGLGCLALMLLVSGVSGRVEAQHLRPLVTEPVETLPSGEFELRLGAQYLEDFRSPVDDREGALARFPTIGVRVGLCSRVEIQAMGPAFQYLDPGQAMDSTQAVGSFALHTKVKLLEPRALRPGLAFRWGTKLPNVDEETGIDTDETDFFTEALLEIQRRRFSLWGSAGFWILGEPDSAAAQDDLYSFGLAVHVPVSRFALLSEVTGAVGPDRQERVLFRIGAASALVGKARLDAVFSSGLKGEAAPSWELAAGVTLRFRGLDLVNPPPDWHP